MRLIGARQAWAESMHFSKTSAEALAIEHARLGKRGHVAKETARRRRDDRVIVDQVEAGYVQHAISSLPRPLQHLGHFMYSPLATREDLSIAQSYVWFGSDYGVSPHRAQRGYWLTLMVMQSHKRMVVGREPIGPTEACAFVEDRLGERMDASNWARDWSGTWEKIAAQVDRLDAQALAPVAVIVARLCGDLAA